MKSLRKGTKLTLQSTVLEFLKPTFNANEAVFDIGDMIALQMNAIRTKPSFPGMLSRLPAYPFIQRYNKPHEKYNK